MQSSILPLQDDSKSLKAFRFSSSFCASADKTAEFPHCTSLQEPPWVRKMRRLHRKSSAADTYLRPTSGAGVETLVGGMTDFRQVFRKKLARQLVSGSNSYKTERVHVPCARTQTECSTERTKARTEQNSSLPTPLENCMQPREIDIKFTPLRARVNKSSEFSMDQCTPSSRLLCRSNSKTQLGSWSQHQMPWPRLAGL